MSSTLLREGRDTENVLQESLRASKTDDQPRGCIDIHQVNVQQHMRVRLIYRITANHSLISRNQGNAGCHRAFSFSFEYLDRSADTHATEKFLTIFSSLPAPRELHIASVNERIISDLELALKHTGVKFRGVPTLHLFPRRTVQGLAEAFPNVKNLYLSNNKANMAHVRVWSQHKHIELYTYADDEVPCINLCGWTRAALTGQS